MQHPLQLSPTRLFFPPLRATQRPLRLCVIFSVAAFFIRRSTKKRRIAAARPAILSRSRSLRPRIKTYLRATLLFIPEDPIHLRRAIKRHATADHKARINIPRDKALPVFECRLCLTAPQAKFIQVYIVRRRTLSERSRTTGLIRNCYADADADAARVFRREPLSKVSGTPSLAFAHVACISARKASDTASDRRSPRATRLTYEGSHPTFCATRL